MNLGDTNTFNSEIGGLNKEVTSIKGIESPI